MKDGIPQLAAKVNTAPNLYAHLSKNLDTLNGMLKEAGADYSFQYGDDDNVFHIEKVTPDGLEEVGLIRALGHNEELGEPLYTTSFGFMPQVRRSAIGVLSFVKGRLVEAIDVDTKIKLPAPGSLSESFARSVLLNIENDPWKIIHETVSAEADGLNAKLQQVKAPFQFSLIYADQVLILNKLTMDGGADTAMIIEPLDDLPAYHLSHDDESVEVVLEDAVTRIRNRINEMLPAETKAALARLDGGAGNQPGAPRPAV